MRAMVLYEGKNSLSLSDVPKPKPKDSQVLIKVHACALCRTDIHLVDGELPHPKFPLIPGHQIVGEIVELGKNVTLHRLGDIVGLPWLNLACGNCLYCRQKQENLCENALFTGYTIDGGFAEYCIGHEGFVFPLPSTYSDEKISPLLCAGLIGFRALKMTKGAQKIGFYGFGNAAHILIQAVKIQGGEVFVFTKKNDQAKQEEAISMGATWVGDSDTLPKKPLDAAIIFAADGSLIPQALKACRKGGKVVIAGIHMSPIPSFSYDLLWEERSIQSVANLTREDATEFLSLASSYHFETTISIYPLEKINEAIDAFRKGKLKGAAVIKL